MRKTNVFGKKINQFKPLYFIAVIFALVLAAFFGVTYYQNTRIAELKQQEDQIQQQINLIVNRQVTTYHDVDQILPYLPTTYDQLRLINELDFIRAVSGLSTSLNYSTSFNENAANPFAEITLPSTIEIVSITVSMLVPNVDSIYDYLDQVIAQERLYYIGTVNITIPQSGDLAFTAVLFTFYNPVSI